MKQLFFLFLFAVSAVSNLCAQTGVLDNEFGTRGIATTIYGTDSVASHTSVLQPDGKILLVAGTGDNQVVVLRYTSLGGVDNSFGTNGKATIIAASGFNLGNTPSLAVQPDNKIVYASNAQGRIVLARLNADGSVDNSFGTSGMVYGPYNAAWSSQVWTVIVKPDGKIITTGTAISGSAHYCEVVQFAPTGTVDSSFATNGVFRYNCGTRGGGYSLALLPNGNLLAGMIKSSPVGTMSVVRLLTNGTIDNTFGTSGVGTSLQFTSAAGVANFCQVVVQNDGKVLLLGNGYWYGGSAIGLTRLKPNGKADSTFAWQGTLTTTFFSFNDYPTIVNPQADGKLVISGSTNGKFASMRLKVNGTTDSTYGRLGKTLFNVPGTNGRIVGGFMQPDNKMVLSGSFKSNGNYYFVAARFQVTSIELYNILYGYSYLDLNNNGIKDNFESLIYNAKYTIIKPNLDSITVQAWNGTFTAPYLDTGTYISNTQFSTPAYFAAPTPVDHITSNSTYFNWDSIFFRTMPLPGHTDACISLIPCTRARIGGAVLYGISYQNIGTAISNGVIEFIKDSRLIYSFASVTPTSVNGDTVRWNYSNLLPQQGGWIVVHMSLPIPPAVNIGDTIYSTVTITPDSADINPANNFASLTQLATYSYDPNNKLEIHGGKIPLAKVATGEALFYTINFQNTGNDTAINVFVHDTLSNMLDWNSVQMVSASANYQLTINEGKCVWTFNDINLPDSARSGVASQGYLTYMVKPKTNLHVGDVIRNKAAIYFDYNLPIITNTEATTVVADVQPLKLLSFTARKDGKANKLQWSTAGEVNVERFDIERSNNGREFNNIGMVRAGASSYNFTDYSPSTSISNYYRLKMLDRDGSFTYSKTIQLFIDNPFSITILPNPVKDKLQVNIRSEKKTTLQVQVVAQDGKLLLSEQWSVNEGNTVKTINTSALRKGSYFIRLISSDKEDNVVKFEKM